MTMIDVVYEHGVFRPLEPPDLPEGARGQVIVAAGPGAPEPEDEADDSPGRRAYRMLMEIAALSQPSPNGPTDVAEHHDDYLYPEHGAMP